MFKIKRVLIITVFVFAAILLVACGGESKTEIKINGEVTMEIEVFSEFVDPGIIYPEDYTLVTAGMVDPKHIGKHKIKYSIFTPEGELAKELYRFVNVVDNTSPTYKLSLESKYYIGFEYSIDDFVSSYEDNYDNKYNIEVLPQTISFENSGLQDVEFVLTDSSGNKTIIKEKVNVILDFEKLIDEAYKLQSYKVSKSVIGNGSYRVGVDIDAKTSFSTFNNESLHFLKSFDSNLGTSASIQISAKYGEFHNANINYHISGGYNEGYSVGFLNFDATKQYDSISFASFRSTINDLNLNEQDMLDEMNPRVLEVLLEFIEYVETVLKVPFK